MLLYCVNVTIDLSVHDEWLEWMRSVHIPDVMKTGQFVSYQLLRLADLVGKSSTTNPVYQIQYECHSKADLERYWAEFAPSLQAEHTERYAGKFSASRTVYEVLNCK